MSKSIAFSQNWGILQTRMDQRETTWTFSNTKMNDTNSYSGKIRWKNGVICLVSMFPSWVMVLKLSKKVHFLQFCADLSKKPKSVKTIYVHAFESSHYILSKNYMAYRVWATVLEILAIKIPKKMLTQQKYNKILRLQTLISPKQ